MPRSAACLHNAAVCNMLFVFMCALSCNNAHRPERERLFQRRLPFLKPFCHRYFSRAVFVFVLLLLCVRVLLCHDTIQQTTARAPAGLAKAPIIHTVVLALKEPTLIFRQ